MSGARTPALEWVGQVAIYAPTSKGYYRLKWQEPDGRSGDTSAGRTLEDARWKAGEITGRLEMAAGPYAVASLRDLVEEYVATAVHPRTGRPLPEVPHAAGRGQPAEGDPRLRGPPGDGRGPGPVRPDARPGRHRPDGGTTPPHCAPC